MDFEFQSHTTRDYLTYYPTHLNIWLHGSERKSDLKDYKNMDYILYGVSALLDEFLLAFLRVNEQACAKR